MIVVCPHAARVIEAYFHSFKKHIESLWEELDRRVISRQPSPANVVISPWCYRSIPLASSIRLCEYASAGLRAKANMNFELCPDPGQRLSLHLVCHFLNKKIIFKPNINVFPFYILTDPELQNKLWCDGERSS